MPDLAPVVPKVGWPVLHLFYRVDASALADLPPTAGKDLARVLTEHAEAIQLHAFTAIGHKADIMLFALDEDLTKLRALQTAVSTCQAGPALMLDWSYLSLTEAGEYISTEADERARLIEAGEEGDELERRVQKWQERIDGYVDHKLHPQMPEWELACFYPMSHRREGEDNWYSLDFDRRKELMHDHGKSGRAYTGRVLQLVSGSTGLDEWEWGVTLFAHDLESLKDIVYTMRYDVASARYAEFGDFVVGIRRTPLELAAEIGLPTDAA